MGIAEIFQETPDFITSIGSSLSGTVSALIIIMLLIAVLYWIRSLQRKGGTEIRVYRRP
jgi:hypothetical protein